MTTVTYQDKIYHVTQGSSVLEALESGGANVLSSCRHGSCQTCKKKITQGKIPREAQTSLKPTEQKAGYFLPCICYPTDDITIADINQAVRYEVTVLSITSLNNEVMEVQLSHPNGFVYQAGQFIQLFRSDRQVRTYSLASVPAKDEPLTLQVKIISDGHVSPWLSTLTPGEKIHIAGPFGECFYTNHHKTQTIIMIGTGTGLSPLYGILHDALLQQHEGAIYLFHGVAKCPSLYKEDYLRQLTHQFPQFQYFPCISDEKREHYEYGMVLDVAFKKVPNVKGSRIFLCGHAEMVKSAKKKMFIAGVALQDIYADPFG